MARTQSVDELLWYIVWQRGPYDDSPWVVFHRTQGVGGVGFEFDAGCQGLAHGSTVRLVEYMPSENQNDPDDGRLCRETEPTCRNCGFPFLPGEEQKAVAPEKRGQEHADPYVCISRLRTAYEGTLPDRELAAKVREQEEESRRQYIRYGGEI